MYSVPQQNLEDEPYMDNIPSGHNPSVQQASPPGLELATLAGTVGLSAVGTGQHQKFSGTVLMR